MPDELIIAGNPEGAVAPVSIAAAKQALARAESVAEIREVEGMIDGFEHYMRASGRWPESEMRAITEVRVRARWKLGKLLFYTARSQGARSDRATSFPMETKSLPLRATLDATGIKPKLAHEAQKLAALPEAELDAAFADYDRESSFPSFRGLIDRARPYWYRESRLAKHQKIAGAATGRLENLGPFPLIYADPPWKFEIYSEIGAERTPDQHYPTLSDQEIIDFKVGGKPVKDIAHKDAALFLWCTSSNLERALGILKGWGFTFKTSAVWVKDRSGTGLVFRNQHEVLLYGTRGSMPGPQHQPRSVFQYPRGEHSAKPPEIRGAIERMYPDFDAATRLELFTRTRNEGWTGYGYESDVS